MKYPCPCCGNRTLSQPDYGSFEICPVCYWEDARRSGKRMLLIILISIVSILCISAGDTHV
ncbi:MAG: hypothetical protein GX297_05205 [Treponema sp.]|nr:hypothetical protein [Treponema sp.]